MKRVNAQGDGYNGRYRLLLTPRGYCYIGEGGDYLTPGIGLPLHAETPEKLIETIQAHRPKLKITEITE